MGNLDEQSCDGAQKLHDQQHSLGSTHDLWVDGQRPDELSELHLPSDRAKQDGWVPSSHTPSMAQHLESMVEIHPRPTTPASTGSKDIKHLRGSLAVRPLKNITGRLDLLEKELAPMEICQKKFLTGETTGVLIQRTLPQLKLIQTLSFMESFALGTVTMPSP